jgi:hypothetical protein
MTKSVDNLRPNSIIRKCKVTVTLESQLKPSVPFPLEVLEMFVLIVIFTMPLMSWPLNGESFTERIEQGWPTRANSEAVL